MTLLDVPPTSPPPAAAPGTGGDRDARSAAAQREDAQVRLVCALVLAVVLLQRFVVPLGGQGEVPLLVPLALGVAVVAAMAGVLRLDLERAGLVLLAVGVCAFTGLLSLVEGKPDTSLLSLLYLLVVYLPLAFVLARPSRQVLDRSLRFVGSLGAVVGAVAAVQLLSQPLGLRYSDVLADVVPDPFITDSFNTSYPIVYNWSVFKSNAYVFLEPSFCSQFLGIAFVVLLWQGRRGWPLLLVAAGLVSTVAGTGMVVVAVGCAVLVLQRGLGVLKPLLVPLVLVVGVVAATPLGGVLLERATEPGDPDSSASLRFVTPFEVIGGAWLADVPTAVLGAGPGASERLAVRVAGSTALQQPVPLKLLYDYGALATVYFLAGMMWVLLFRAPVLPLAAGMLMSWLILNSALLLPAVVVLLWTLTSLLSSVPDDDRGAAARG